MLKIANAGGFWGDRPSAAADLLEQQPDLDYITLDYLAEVSLSIMALQQEKDPSLGYARDFQQVIESLNPYFERGSKVKVVTNAGGLNPLGLAKALKTEAKIAVVTGDAVSVKGAVTANAYLGAKPIVEALELGADIVITGRVADPSLVVAPAVFHHKWGWDEYDKLAGATVAGHLIECGTQVTGGYYTNWLSVPDKAHIGFPIAEVSKEGWCTITKAEGAGGLVSIETVKEQLLYEIGDPNNYLSPDVTVSFLSLVVEKECEDRIRISGAVGRVPPDTYKVSTTYRDGYRAEAFLVIRGESAATKAKECGRVIFMRVADQGYRLDRTLVEILGQNDPFECVLHVAAADRRKEGLECFAKEIAPLVTSGPQGVTGYTGGRPKVRPVFAYKPATVPQSSVNPKVQLYE